MVGLSAYTQRIVFAEAAVQGKSIFEIDAVGLAAREIDAVKNELLEFIK